MNIQRFVLPATVAAALHAVLLCAIPDTIRLPKFILAERPPKTINLPEEQPLIIEPTKAEIADVSNEVKTLVAGEPRPELPNDLLDQGPKELSIPFENHPVKISTDMKKVGPPGEMGGIGRGDWSKNPPSIKSPDQLDKVPRATVRMPPNYPTALRQDGIEGVVMVEFVVDVKGRVVSAQVRESTHRAFEEPTLRAVLNWRFEPGLSQGRPVSFRMVIPVNFQLGDN